MCETKSFESIQPAKCEDESHDGSDFRFRRFSSLCRQFLVVVVAARLELFTSQRICQLARLNPSSLPVVTI